jgi:hypothetical protein
MAELTCNTNTFILIILIILIVAYTDNIFKNAPILKKLFTDSLNYVLLIILVLLVILVDMSSGIILAFIVLYLSVYVKYNSGINYINKKAHFSDVIATTSNTFKNYIPLSESEFIYNNTKPFPNNNIFPFEPTTQEAINSMSSSKAPMGCGLKATTDPEFITQVGLPSRDGFDVTGCRYDFKNSPQNSTKYGPPLAQCATYSGQQAATCGTVFYPLHA